MVGALVQFFGVICLSEFLANKYGKKRTFIVCLALTAIFTALFYFPSKYDIEMMFVLNILKSLAYAPTVPLSWADVAQSERNEAPANTCRANHRDESASKSFPPK